jgi:uncharacterized membrane protein YdjX (TVP38/TMEM64 family)
MIKQKYLKPFLFLVWLTLLSVAIFSYISLDTPLKEYPALIISFLERFGMWGPILYILIYTIRPLTFFPATVLTTASGAIFGPWYGILYTIIGENLSANLTFLVGRYFGKDLMGKVTSKSKIIFLAECKFRENGFMGVLFMRLLYFPFDIVGYFSGACNLRQRDFALGTFIGILPGLITFVLLGGSFTDPKNLLLAGISKYLKRKNVLNQEVRDVQK